MSNIDNWSFSQHRNNLYFNSWLQTWFNSNCW